MGVAKYIKDEKDAVREVIYPSGIRIKPSYSPRDLEEVGFDYVQDLGEPGEYPFTRSLHPLGYRSRAWTTRQYTGFGTPEETNQRFKLMISHGQTGLNVASTCRLRWATTRMTLWFWARSAGSGWRWTRYGISKPPSRTSL